jgi:ABC-type multidrug transport system fused ATPase/permease subunit
MGGVSSHPIALVKTVGELDGPERYQVVCAQENPDWLRPYLDPSQNTVLGPQRRSRRLALDHFDLSIFPGQIAAIVGPNGADD